MTPRGERVAAWVFTVGFVAYTAVAAAVVNWVTS